MPSGTQFSGGRELEILRQQMPLVGNLLQRLIAAMNRGFRYAGVTVAGELPAPPPIDSIAIKGTLSGGVLTAPGELLHWVHTHNVQLARGIQYITEIDTSPNFPAPHPIDTGSSRSGFTTLPTKDDDGNLVSYYLRATPQYQGSAPATPTVYGGLQGPIPINMSGSTEATLLQSQAGGTAKPNQGGQGLGAVAVRGPVGGPKRNFAHK